MKCINSILKIILIILLWLLFSYGMIKLFLLCFQNLLHNLLVSIGVVKLPTLFGGLLSMFIIIVLTLILIIGVNRWFAKKHTTREYRVGNFLSFIILLIAVMYSGIILSSLFFDFSLPSWFII